jgi:hypothetical protein
MSNIFVWGNNDATVIAIVLLVAMTAHAPAFNAPYRYEVVAAGAPLYPVASRSAHRIPANMQNPHVAEWPVPANMAAMLSTADHVSISSWCSRRRYAPNRTCHPQRIPLRAGGDVRMVDSIFIQQSLQLPDDMRAASPSRGARSVHAIPMRRHSMTPWCITAWTRAKTGCCWGFYTMIRANAAGYPATIPPTALAFIRSLRISDFELVTSGTW